MMKQFFAFLISLSFLVPTTSFSEQVFGGKSGQEIDYNAKRAQDKSAVRALKRRLKCPHGTEKVTLLSEPGVVVNCDNIDDYYESLEISDKNAEACAKSYSEYKEDVKKSKEDAEDRLSELKNDKIEKQASAQEQIIENQEAMNEADLKYQEAMDAYEAALAELEKNTNEAAQAKIKELRAKMTELEKNITIDREELNNQLSSKYDECKGAVMKEFYTQLGNLKQMNKLRNKGVSSSGGASFAKNDYGTLKKNAKEAHVSCIDKVNKGYESAMKQLKIVEKNLTAEVQQLQQEVQRLTGDEYTKNIQKLQKEVIRAQKSAASKKDGLLKKNQMLQQKMSLEQASIEQDIAILQARIEAGEMIDDEDKKFKGLNSKPSYYNDCCENNALKDGFHGYAGVPNTTLCKIATKRKRSTRGKPGTLQ